MEFGLSEEQVLLKDSIARYLNDRAPLDRVRRFAEDKEQRADDVWGGLAELGVPALLISEADGGVGLGMVDAAIVSEELGSHVTPVPFVSTAVLVPRALVTAGSEAQRSDILPKIASGTMRCGTALAHVIGAREGATVKATADAKLNGKALFVIDFHADVYLVADDSGELYLVESGAAGLTQNALTTIDRTRPMGELLFDETPAERLPGSGDREVLLDLIDRGRVMLAADTLGAAQNMLDQSVSYAMQREQFNRVIASFQAVKHMCAEMAAEVEPARALVWYAAHALDEVPDEARLTACHTKAHLAEVGTFVAKTATMVHGGMGFTDLVGLHYWFKRIGSNRQVLGGPEAVRDEAAAAQGLI